MDDLPLQVRQRHRVVVDHAERADAGGRQIHQHRRAEPARADHQHARALERRLTGPADLAQHDVARVALQFLRGQHGCIVFLDRLGFGPLTTRLAMRLAGAVLSSLLVVSLAAAEPAKQAAPKKGRNRKAGRQGGQRRKRPAAPKADKKAGARARSRPPTTPSRSPSASRSRTTSSGPATTTASSTASSANARSRAVKAFQKRNGGKETGVLNPPERAALGAAAKPKQDAVGWRIVDDVRDRRAHRHSGQARCRRQRKSSAASRWASSRGEYSVETFRITQPGTTLAAVFERMKKEPAGRKTDYSVLRPISSSSRACRT